MATRSAQKANASAMVPLDPVERDTLLKIFFHAVDSSSRPDALRYKANGIWHSISHAEVETRVTRLAAALADLGIREGDRVGILSENRPEWAIADYAALGLGVIDVPIYPTLPSNQVAYILGDCRARAVFVSTREQLDKILEARGALDALEFVIVMDDLTADGVVRFSDLLEKGQELVDNGADGFRERALAVGRDEVATLIYTSGTTGDPKGVMLTHYNLASNVAAARQADIMAPNPGDVALSFLPLSHVFERMVDYWYWDAGIAIAYAESIDKVADNLVEVSPNVAVSVPRLFDKIYTKVMGATGVKKKLVMWAKKTGEEVFDEHVAGREPSGSLAFRYRLADKLVFSKLRARTGGALRVFFSGGAPLSADVAKFFFAAGLPVYEGYGLTETSPVISANKPGAVRLGTVGHALPGVEVRIGDGGELLTRGPHVMKGYWKNPTATAEVIDEEGWFYTGDVGEIDADGFIRITDRIKNILVTAGGKNVAPQPMENKAAMSPYIAQVVMIGDRRAYPIMLIVPDFENLGGWASAQGIDTSNAEKLAREPRVVELLEQEALGRLTEFARYELPKKVAILPEELTVESGLMTPTLKVKRKAVEERYREMIEAMYA
ncbi:MAG TPA: long-chain fatty acid--CoA ligase [Longimicrobiaceae bacterium]|nr:long-chain fatty acid--CoA ligase [Longimicrobiaceae bacterium]